MACDRADLAEKGAEARIKTQGRERAGPDCCAGLLSYIVLRAIAADSLGLALAVDQ